jgi:hypothetical protein
MKSKLLVLFAAAGLSIAAAKSYDIMLGQAAMIGNTQVQPGDYRLKLSGSSVTLTDSMNGKKIEANAKVESVAKKYEHTAILSKKVNGTDHIDEIQLGGTKTKLDFNANSNSSSE